MQHTYMYLEIHNHNSTTYDTIQKCDDLFLNIILFFDIIISLSLQNK